MQGSQLTISITKPIAKKIDVYVIKESGQKYIILDSGEILELDNDENVEME